MLSRYDYVNIIEGKTKSNSECIAIIQRGIDLGEIDFEILTLGGNQRLDTISGQYYGDSSYWWIIAAASGIGWGMQITPGTLIKVPKNINQVLVLL